MDRDLAAKIIIMKKDTKLFQVNLQNGFILDSETETIYAAYNHHNQAIATVAPWTDKDFSIPISLKGYKIYNRLVAHFCITGWTHTGEVLISDLTRMLTNEEKAKLLDKL